jgi:hypothetical protein
MTSPDWRGGEARASVAEPDDRKGFKVDVEVGETGASVGSVRRTGVFCFEDGGVRWAMAI